MSCYLRHFGGIMERAGVTLANKEERRLVERAVREIVGKPGAGCPEVWKEVKLWLQRPGGEDELVSCL
jgi:hypothetical protein